MKNYHVIACLSILLFFTLVTNGCDCGHDGKEYTVTIHNNTDFSIKVDYHRLHSSFIWFCETTESVSTRIASESSKRIDIYFDAGVDELSELDVTMDGISVTYIISKTDQTVFVEEDDFYE